jgi:glycosyltransferase involved in cell wall biosynthesis
MRRVLIITEAFPPAFNPRMGYLAKFLPEFNWAADIITHNSVRDNNFKELVGKNRIVRVNLIHDHNATPHGFIQKLWRLLNLKRHFLSNKKPFVEALESNFKKEDFSMILVSVSYDLFVLEAGWIIAKKLDIPLVVDIRDMPEQKPSAKDYGRGIKALLISSLSRSFERKIILLRNKILKNAAAVTTISPYHAEKLSKFNYNVKLIYNGYDPDLFNPDSIEKTDIFYLLYTGLIFKEEEQDPSILFEAVSQLEKDKIINNERFRIQFYTPLNFRSTVYNNRYFPLVEKYIDFFDYVDYNQIPHLLQRTSIALVLTNFSGNKGPKGVLTTKFFDYLGAERPVLCVRNDEGILEKTIINANIGISARTVDEAYNFILEKWNEWEVNRCTTSKVNQEFRKQFSRRAQAKQFVDLFESVVPQR